MKTYINKWFYISDKTYVEQKGDTMMLYQTKIGTLIETTNILFIELINELYEKNNLGVIELNDKYINNKDCEKLISESIEKKITGIKEKTGLYKPFVLMPIFYLKTDIEEQQEQAIQLISNDPLIYLKEINLYINEECKYNCKYCKRYNKQFLFCIKGIHYNAMDVNTIDLLFSQLQKGVKINILGGDLNKYPYWDNLNLIFDKYNACVNFYIHYKQLLNLDEGLKINLENKNNNTIILVDFPLENDFKNTLKKYNNETFNFIITNESECKNVEKILNANSQLNFNIVPFYTGENISFFKNYVFLNKSDLFGSTISQRQIFCNKKLNSNYFGKLYIDSYGDIKANANKNTIGNIKNDSLIRTVYNELVNNTSWRMVRNNDICNFCLYQFLCPPPSNYEQVIGNPNLCHMEPIINVGNSIER